MKRIRVANKFLTRSEYYDDLIGRGWDKVSAHNMVYKAFSPWHSFKFWLKGLFK